MGTIRSRIPWWAWAFLAFLGLVLAFFVFLLVGGDEESAQPTTPLTITQPSSSAPEPTSQNTDSDASVCGLLAGDQAIPEEAPDTQWELVNGFALPTSDGFGPGIREGSQIKCFAHNPTGALFAAARVVSVTFLSEEHAKVFLSDPTQVRYASEDMRKEALASIEPVDMEGNSLQIAGFKIRQNSPDNVVVYLAFDAEVDGRRGIMVLPWEMQWSKGDWVYQAPSYQQNAEQVPSLVSENFIPWSGVN